jgi:hypothetical protein
MTQEVHLEMTFRNWAPMLLSQFSIAGYWSAVLLQEDEMMASLGSETQVCVVMAATK